jgi:hypothetical protein
MHLQTDDANDLRQEIIAGLRRAIAAHAQGRVLEIEDNVDELAMRVSELAEPGLDSFNIAIEFWSGWSDSAVHDWLYYPGMTKEAWPVMANSIVQDLAARREISDPTIVEQFRPRASAPGLLGRFLNWIARLRSDRPRRQ